MHGREEVRRAMHLEETVFGAFANSVNFYVQAGGWFGLITAAIAFCAPLNFDHIIVMAIYSLNLFIS